MLHSIKNVSIENREIPKLRNDHDVRVHIEQTGICGSDVHYWLRLSEEPAVDAATI